MHTAFCLNKCIHWAALLCHANTANQPGRVNVNFVGTIQKFMNVKNVIENEIAWLSVVLMIINTSTLRAYCLTDISRDGSANRSSPISSQQLGYVIIIILRVPCRRWEHETKGRQTFTTPASNERVWSYRNINTLGYLLSDIHWRWPWTSYFAYKHHTGMATGLLVLCSHFAKRSSIAECAFTNIHMWRSYIFFSHFR